MGNRVVHFEIHTQNQDDLGKFFAELFGWNVQPTPMGDAGNYVVVDTASGGGINGGIGGIDSNILGSTFYVEVPDLQKALDKIETLGGKTVVGITEIPNIVTFAQFADVEGNIIGLVASSPVEGPGVSAGSNPPIDWFEVLGANGKALQEFYSKAFDWKIKSSQVEGIEYGEVDTGAAGGISGGIGTSQDGTKAVTLYAKVDSVEKFLDKAAGLGGKTVLEATEVMPGLTVGLFLDPQGNIFGLYQR